VSRSRSQQQFVRQVLINPDGLQTTNTALVWRNVHLNPGDPLSPTAITDTQRRLYDLGIFARVDGASRIPMANRPQIRSVHMEEAARYHWRGGGRRTRRHRRCQLPRRSRRATGFSARVSLECHAQNLWGLGHSLSLRTRPPHWSSAPCSPIFWPRFHSLDRFNLSFTALYDNSRDVRTFSSKRQGRARSAFPRLSKRARCSTASAIGRASVSDLKISQSWSPNSPSPYAFASSLSRYINDRR